MGNRDVRTAAYEDRVSYVLINKSSGMACLVWTGSALEFWKLQDYIQRFDTLGFRLCEVTDRPAPTEYIEQALMNLEEVD